MKRQITTRLRRIGALLLVLFFAPGIVVAADYYASTGGGGDCTAGSPCDLDAALGAMAANDTLYLNAGTYVLSDTIQVQNGWTIRPVNTGVVFDGSLLSYYSPAGIYVMADNATIQGITFENFSTWAIAIYGNFNKVSGCTIYNTWSGIEANGSGNQIEENTFSQCYQGISVTAMGMPGTNKSMSKRAKATLPSETPGMTQINNNLLIEAGQGILFGGGGITPVSVTIWHNTIVGGVESGTGIYIGQDPAYENGIEADMQFNIVTGFTTGIIFDPLYYGDKKKKDGGDKSAKALPDGVSIWSNYNDLFSNTTNHDGLTPESIGPNNIFADPLFVSAATGDFHLSEGSPCRNRIPSDASPVIVDRDGLARPQGTAKDMGCYEIKETIVIPPEPEPVYLSLIVGRQPAEGGRVTGDGIDCPEVCESSYLYGVRVDLTAVAAEGYAFIRWEGDMESTGNPLTVRMYDDRKITAVFQKQLRMDVSIDPQGSGRVTGQGIDCPEDCAGLYLPEEDARLMAVPGDGYRFMSWSGHASGTANPVAILMNEDKAVTAHFRVNQAPVFEPYPDRRINRNVLIEFEVTATDPDGDPLVYSAANLPMGAMFSNRTFSWTPGYDQAGVHVVTFDVSDGAVSDTMDVAIEVNEEDSSPPYQPFYTGVFPPIFPPGCVVLNFSGYDDPENDAYFMTFFRIRRADQPYWLETMTFTDINRFLVEFCNLTGGMKYVWQVGYMDNGSGIISWSDPFEIIIGRVEESPPIAFEPGDTLEDYILISITYWPNDNRASAVFGSGYDPGLFRAGTYDPNYRGGGYIPFDELTIDPGRSYWFLARDGMVIPPSDDVPVSMDVNLEAPLWFNQTTGDGWNMIAAPNTADYRWRDVQVKVYDEHGNTVFGPVAIDELTDSNPYIDLRLWGWNAGAYFDAEWIQRESGYWVKALKPYVSLVFPVSAQGVMPAGAAGRKAVKSAGDDGPPMPIPDFHSPMPADAGNSNAGCFIGSIR